MSKKRKHSSTLSEGVVFNLSAPNPSQTGPMLVSYPSIQAPLSTAFRCYATKRAKVHEGQAQNTEKDILLVGETEEVEFISNKAETQLVAYSGCRYLIAVHNRRSSKLSILPTPKIPFILSRTVKALKNITPSEPTIQQYTQARASLGEAFGTKKAKASIQARERNRVDVDAMKGVMGHLQQGIDAGAAGLMTAEQAKDAADQNRLIPPFDTTAKDPDGVYPLHGIIPEIEWKALSVSQFNQAESPDERNALLYWNKSEWLKSHLEAKSQEPQTSKKKKRDLKILLYISALLRFRQAIGFNGSSKDELVEKLSKLPGVVVDGLLSRFSETSRGSNIHKFTSATQTKLLTFAFSLCLKLDNFATDTKLIAHDIGKSVRDINTLFRSLGCKISTLNEQERVKLGLSDSSAKLQRAVLKAPVVFPKPKVRRT